MELILGKSAGAVFQQQLQHTESLGRKVDRLLLSEDFTSLRIEEAIIEPQTHLDSPGLDSMRRSPGSILRKDPLDDIPNPLLA